MNTMPDYLGIIAPQEINQVQKAIAAGTRHPLLALARSESANQVATNTEAAARHVFRKNESWLRALKPRLLDRTDTANASSVLGEIRAYGALLETAMKVTPAPTVPGSNVSPEFEADAGDGSIIIEVHSRQLDAAQVQALEQHRQDLEQKHKANVDKSKAAGKSRVVTSSAIGVTPFGAPDGLKPGDSVLTNTISRICNIKKGDKQIDPAKPFILWLDLEDPIVWGWLSISLAQLVPVYTEQKDGAVGAGGLWYALYGKKGDPMLEMQGLDYRRASMLHDGRFTLSPMISAVVYALPKATVLFENPAPINRLPQNCRISLLKTPFFRLEYSCCEWALGLVESEVHLQKRKVAAAADALVAFNPP
jgi:hypothetical protein